MCQTKPTNSVHFMFYVSWQLSSDLVLPVYTIKHFKLLNLNLQLLHIFCHSTLQIYHNNNFLIWFSNTIDYISHHISLMSIQSKSMWPNLSKKSMSCWNLKLKLISLSFKNGFKTRNWKQRPPPHPWHLWILMPNQGGRHHKPII